MFDRTMFDRGNLLSILVGGEIGGEMVTPSWAETLLRFLLFDDLFEFDNFFFDAG